MFEIFNRKLSSAIPLIATQLSQGVINHSCALINIPKSFSQQLVENVSVQIPQGSTIFKPTTLKNIKSQEQMFDDLLSKFPEVKAQIEAVKKQSIILIKGLKTPELEMPKIPQSKFDVEKLYKYKELKIAEIIAGLMIEKFLNIHEMPESFNLIYPSQEDIDKTNSFSSNRELLWHADGWGSNPQKNVALFCLVGNQSAITEVISSKQIIDYFVENKKEHLLQVLQENFYIKTGGEEYIYPQAPIIDEVGNIRFSEYGIFQKTGSLEDIKIGNEAIKELKLALKTIAPALSLSMQNGDLLIIDNLQNLHRRTTAEGMPAMNPSQANSRLLLRAVLDEWKRGK
jgi:hypothetical protein